MKRAMGPMPQPLTRRAARRRLDTMLTLMCMCSACRAIDPKRAEAWEAVQVDARASAARKLERSRAYEQAKRVAS